MTDAYPRLRNGARITHQLGRVAALCCMLVACGGGGSGTGSPGGIAEPPPNTGPSYSLVSPQDTAPIRFLCGDADGDATQARYLDKGKTKLVALPDGKLLGNTSTTPASYFIVDTQGRRTAFTPRAVDKFRVDTEGMLWWTDANKVLWRGALQADGKDERIGKITDFSGLPTDGPSDSATLGTINDFAAVPGAVYLVMSDSSASHSYVRRLTHNPTGGWQVSTVALPDSVVSGGDSVQIRSNPKGLLALLITHASPGPAYYQEDMALTYWQLGTNNTWQSRASKSFRVEHIPSTIYSVNLDSVALNNAGDLIWGGGGNGRLYQMGQDGSWTVLSSPSSANIGGLGQDGRLGTVSFLSAYSVVTSADGNTVFYDGNVCQVRKLTDTTLTTVSGPRYVTRSHFASATLLGFDNQGKLVFHHGAQQYMPPTPLVSRYDITDASFAVMEGMGTPRRPDSVSILRLGSEACSQDDNCDSFVWGLSNPDIRRFLAIDWASDTIYAADVKGMLFRSGPSGYVAIASKPPQFTTTYYGPETPSIVGGDFPYFVGEIPDVYSWPVAVRLNVPGDTFSVVAGGSTISDLFPGKKPSLAGFDLQARSDGGFWTASFRGVARIDKSGNSTDVAGCLLFVKLSCDLSGTLDGQGSNAAFQNIKRIRVLPDNRLLVLDQNAVRLVDDAGNVRTLFTLASTGLPGSNFVDMIPRGRDVYLTLDDQPRLALAKNVIP